jgi:hypothetical protein
MASFEPHLRHLACVVIDPLYRNASRTHGKIGIFLSARFGKMQRQRGEFRVNCIVYFFKLKNSSIDTISRESHLHRWLLFSPRPSGYDRRSRERELKAHTGLNATETSQDLASFRIRGAMMLSRNYNCCRQIGPRNISRTLQPVLLPQREVLGRRSRNGLEHTS